MSLAELIIYKSDDGGESFDPVKPYNVPDEIKNDPEILGQMEAGMAAQLPGETTCYIAQRVSNAGHNLSSDIIILDTSNVH